MKRLFMILLIGLFLAGTCSMLNGKVFAKWYTHMGVITTMLHDDITPITVNNFISLSNSHFYDGLHFHRVIPGFVIQDGDPLGSGYGGPGYTIADEFSPLLHHDSAGVLAMANTGQPHSAGSQYYITLAPQPHLDGGYAIFGKVIEGLDVVMALGQVATDANDHPIDVLGATIDSIRIMGLVINSTSPEDSLQVEVGTSVDFAMQSFDLYTMAYYRWYVDEVLQTLAVDFMFTHQFNDPGTHTIRCETYDEQFTWSYTWHIQVGPVMNNDIIQPLTTRDVSVYPNPFRGNTTLSIAMKQVQPVSVSIYNLRGQKIRQLSSQNLTQGVVDFYWDGKNQEGQIAAPGLYFARITAGRNHLIHKMMIH